MQPNPKRKRWWEAIAILLIASSLLGCGTTKLEPGGPYAPTNAVPGSVLPAPDPAFFAVDATFKLAYSALDAAFKFEYDNADLLWAISPTIKRELDKLRPKAIEIRNAYAVARAAYKANPTPANLSALESAMARCQQLAGVAQAILPKPKTQ